MALSSGARLGPYEVIAPLGSGGMGEVYRARDTKLNRDVALKVLPDSFALDADRLARFKREAQVLASLNHPNIAQIYGFEDSGATHALVMELVEGPTLADRIAGSGLSALDSGHAAPPKAQSLEAKAKSTALPLAEALAIAKQIAEALEAAHEQGIIHRDLKPANIKVRDDGMVKVLDFGLAKMLDPVSAESIGQRADAQLTASPTITSPAMMTGMGVILGTAAYMSPEQAKGRPADKRSDVWAFGCVLYEMLAGRRPFDAEDLSTTLAAVIMKEPDWTALPSSVPAAIRTLVQRCLEKDRRQRIADISVARFVFAEHANLGDATLAARRAVQGISLPLWKRAIPIAATAIVVGAIASMATWWNVRAVSSAAVVMRFPLILPDDFQFSRAGGRMVAVSPDGTRIAYQGNQQLFLRSMVDMDARPISGTINLDPAYPVFSPDGQWIAFASVADQTLKKIAVSGGAPLTLYKFGSVLRVADFQGPSWDGDQILFAQADKGVKRISANGGEPETLVAVKGSEQVYGPQLLPGGKALLFSLATETGAGRWDNGQIVVQSLTSGERKVLVRGGGAAQYVPTGHIVYALGNTLLAIPFDVSRLEVRGGPVPIVEGVRRAGVLSGAAQFAVSETGSLVYVPGPASSLTPRTLAIAHRDGKIEPLGLPAQPYLHPRISPDGRQVAFATDDGTSSIVWVADLKIAATPRRLTFAGRNESPIWSRDGRFIIFQSDREGDRSLFRHRADGTGTTERLTKAEAGVEHRPEGWSPDGKILSFVTVASGAAGGDIWTLSLDGDPKPKPLVQMPSNERHSAFSPDGRWFAYSSSEVGGKLEVFVQPFPPTGTKYQISMGGGRDPLWSPDGRQLYYDTVTGGGNLGDLMSIEVRTQPVFGFGSPTHLPIKQALWGGQGRYYDITPDGQRFLIVLPAAAGSTSLKPPAEQINVVLNWFEELKTRVPATR